MTTSKRKPLSCGHIPADPKIRDLVRNDPPLNEKTANAKEGIYATNVREKCGIGGYYCAKDECGARLDHVYKSIVDIRAIDADQTKRLYEVMELNKQFQLGNTTAFAKDDPVIAQIGAAIFELTMSKQYYAWLLREMDRRIDVALNHYMIVVPAAKAGKKIPPTLTFPETEHRMTFENALKLGPTKHSVDMAMGTVSTEMEPLVTTVKKRADLNGIGYYPTFDKLPRDPITNSRAEAIEALARASLEQSRAHVYTTTGYRFDPRVPVRARRSMEAGGGDSASSTTSKTLSPKSTSTPTSVVRRTRRVKKDINYTELGFDPDTYEEHGVIQSIEQEAENRLMVTLKYPAVDQMQYAVPPLVGAGFHEQSSLPAPFQQLSTLDVMQPGMRRSLFFPQQTQSPAVASNWLYQTHHPVYTDPLPYVGLTPDISNHDGIVDANHGGAMHASNDYQMPAGLLPSAMEDNTFVNKRVRTAYMSTPSNPNFYPITDRGARSYNDPTSVYDYGFGEQSFYPSSAAAARDNINMDGYGGDGSFDMTPYDDESFDMTPYETSEGDNGNGNVNSSSFGVDGAFDMDSFSYGNDEAFDMEIFGIGGAFS